jgi:glycerol 3-phosphatase-2
VSDALGDKHPGSPVPDSATTGSKLEATNNSGNDNGNGMSPDDQIGAYEWYRRGAALHAGGHPAAAAEALAHAVTAEPTACSIREAWARALFDSRRYSEALTQFLVVIEQAPAEDYAHFGAGLCHWRLYQLLSAARYLAIAVAMRPANKEYARALVQIRSTLKAREAVGQPADGPFAASVSVESTVDLEVRTIAERQTTGVPFQKLTKKAPGETPTQHPATRLCAVYDVGLLDLDGVVYRSGHAINHAAQSIRRAVNEGMRMAYVTNNAARTPAEVAANLRAFELEVADEEVVTSAQAAASMLIGQVLPGAAVLAIGGAGVAAALSAAGFVPVLPHQAQPPRDFVGPLVAVVMGYGVDVAWRDLAEAAYAVEAGAIFVATNTDSSIPTSRGVAPGNGALVSAVSVATGVDPQVAGKPYPPLLQQSIDRTAATSPLVVGDRLDTDIEAANRLELDSLLVLTGVTDAPTLLIAPPMLRPTFLAADLRGLLEPGQTFATTPFALVGPGGELVLTGRPDRTDPLARIRGAAAVCWAATDAGGSPFWSQDVASSLAADIADALDSADR